MLPSLYYVVSAFLLFLGAWQHQPMQAAATACNTRPHLKRKPACTTKPPASHTQPSNSKRQRIELTPNKHKAANKKQMERYKACTQEIQKLNSILQEKTFLTGITTQEVGAAMECVHILDAYRIELMVGSVSLAREALNLLMKFHALLSNCDLEQALVQVAIDNYQAPLVQLDNELKQWMYNIRYLDEETTKNIERIIYEINDVLRCRGEGFSGADDEATLVAYEQWLTACFSQVIFQDRDLPLTMINVINNCRQSTNRAELTEASQVPSSGSGGSDELVIHVRSNCSSSDNA